jgi:hypothetical protein
MLNRRDWVALFSVVVVFYTAVIILGTAGLCMRYDPACPEWRRKHRWNVSFTPGYYLEYLAAHPERPFEIVGAPVLPSKRVVSYSLYGNHPKYMRYMSRNFDQIREKLPGWKARVYLHEGSSSQWREALTRSDVDLFIVRDPEVVPGNSAGAFWRFLPLCEDDVDCIVMDADNKLTDALTDKIRKFFSATGGAVIRHDNTFPWPVEAIRATDMFKKKEFRLPFTTEQLCCYPHRSTFGSDEAFLLAEVAPHAELQGNKCPFLFHHYFVKETVELPRVMSGSFK